MLSIELFSRVVGGFRSRCLLDHNEALSRLSYVHQVLPEIKSETVTVRCSPI